MLATKAAFGDGLVESEVCLNRSVNSIEDVDSGGITNDWLWFKKVYSIIILDTVVKVER